jgi:hypothetical protein
MSDTQQGPGWWMASDGKWYPPQGEQLPPPPPPGFPQYVNPTGNFAQRPESVSPALSIWLQVLLLLAATTMTVAACLIPSVVSAASQYVQTSKAFSLPFLTEWQEADDRFGIFYGLYIWLAVPVFTLLIIFSYRAYKTTQSLWSGSRKWSRGWTVGGWFIPFANFIIIPLVWMEIDRISVASRTENSNETKWGSASANPVLIFWWVLFVAGTFMSLGFSYANRSGMNYFDSEIFSEYKIGMYIGMFGGFMVAASCVLAALTVRRMGKALSPGSIGV